MEHHKALFLYTVSNREVRKKLEKLLVKNHFKRLSEQSS